MCRPAARWHASFTLTALILAGATVEVAGQSSEAPRPPASTPTTLWSVRNWTRVEGWRFFRPLPGGGDPNYVFVANRLQLMVRRDTRRYTATAAVQHVQFGGLPATATGPGALGLGAVYFAHAGRSDSNQLYARYLNLRLKEVLPGLSLQLGRMPYASGGDSPSGDAKVDLLRQQRVEARLVGEFDWSIYQRAFDGVRVDVVHAPWSATAVALHPTQGGFEDAAGLPIPDVTVLGGSVSLRPGPRRGRVDWQGFAYRYLDTRAVTGRPDNSGTTAARADVRVDTFGTALVAASSPVDGRQADAVVWLAGQTGAWYGQSHRAASVAAEAGYQWSATRMRPWLRAGLLVASGDGDPSDERHGTFFQMLPTVRRYAQSALFSQMNAIDLFGQAMLRPTPALALRVDVHHLRLASAKDLWYFGSGATQRRGTMFGFAGRPSNGQTGLGTSVEVSADRAISSRWSINGYLGVTRGGEVVRAAFARRTLTFAYVENVVRF